MIDMKYFAMGFTSYVTLAVIHGWGDQDVMMAMLITLVGLWITYFFYLLSNGKIS